VEQCARAGIKATQQRREIHRELSNTDEHPDAEALYVRVRRRVPAISLDTVYRNLRLLEDHGIIRKVGVTGYRTRFDANMDPHHHFVCVQCGLIRDFYDARFDRYRAAASVRKIGKVDSLHVELRGVCRGCRGEQDTARVGGKR
jgi:Fur family peroxide stress response transcriptional regulator